PARRRGRIKAAPVHSPPPAADRGSALAPRRLWSPRFNDSGTDMAATALQLATRIAGEIGARPQQAEAAIGLLDEGATVPFIARYRKEVTGGLDDTQLRLLAERLAYLRELEARRDTILSSIREQG